MADTALQNAIADAEKQLTEKIEGKEGTPAAPASEPEVEIETETEDSEAEPESDDEPELSEDELLESKKLYRALKDPKTAKPIVAALAAQVGVNLTAESTKREVTEAKKSILDVVSEALGENYKFLAPQLGKAIESALDIQRKENEASLAEIRQSQIERDVTTAYEKLARETKGESKKLESKMAALSEEIPIGTMSVDKYIHRLYTLVAAESQKTNAKATADRIRKNATNAPERLRSGSPAGTEPKIPDKKMNLKESVAFALGELTKGR